MTNIDTTKVKKIEFKKPDDNFLKYGNCIRCIIQGEICNNHKCI